MARLEEMMLRANLPETASRVGVLLLGPMLMAGLLASCGVAPRSAATLNHGGNQQYDAGAYSNALENYREAEVLRPDLPALNYNAGNALIQRRSYQQAITEDQQAARSTDADVQDRAFYSMGNAYVGLNDLEGAVEAYKSALRANPSDINAKYNLEVVEQQLAQQQASAPQQSAQAQPGQAGSGQQGQQGGPQAGAQQGQAGQPGPGGQQAQAGQPGPGGQEAQGGQPPDTAQAAPGAGAAAGTPGGSNGSAGGYTGTPAGQAAALDPSLQQALGSFDKTGSVDSALQALDIIAQQERLQQSGNGPPPDPQDKGW